ncbi:bifunctional phosphopantothenoylcysteine decarboxylase/phosphopantothenate--cysteine ligase CoaBC [Desulfonauticus submarinus]
MLFQHYYGKNVHIGITGSIAAYKSLDLLRLLVQSNIKVTATLTKAGQEFVPALNFRSLGATTVFEEKDFFASDFPHLYPQKGIDSFLICPCSANTLIKIAFGFADNLLTTQVLAFEGPLLIAPAMNFKMWNNVRVQNAVKMLEEQGVFVIEPGEGKMACGDVGKGRLADIDCIYFYVLKSITPQDMTGKKVLITTGPTREYYDLVRFWSNPSSGKTGLALGLAAWLRGADVFLICGPISEKIVSLPGLHIYPITTAKEMQEIALKLWKSMDIGVCAAAVCDFRPEYIGDLKVKKGNKAGLTVKFVNNPDILLTLGQSKRVDQKLVGFALEYENLRKEAKRKLEQKKLDLIVGNQVNITSPFGREKNTVLVLDKEGREEEWPDLPKTEIAWRLWDILLSL